MIVVDARPLALPLTGVGRYALEVLERLPLPAGTVAVARPGTELAGLPVPVLHRGPAAPDLLWNEVSVAPLLRRASAYLALNGQLPWTVTGRCRTVSLVHDLVHRDRGVDMPWGLRLSRESAVLASVRRATVLATTTQYVSDQLATRYGRPADLVLPAGPTLPTASPEDVDRARRVLAARPDATRWVLAVGSEVPRKNYPRLTRAVAGLPATGLVLVGGRSDRAVGAALDALGDRLPLLRPGYVDQGLLAGLYAVTDVLGYPSLAEGNGLPLQDARRAGLPVLTSDRQPMAAHAGPAGRLVDPLDEEALGNALATVLAAPRPAPEVLPGWDETAGELARALGLW